MASAPASRDRHQRDLRAAWTLQLPLGVYKIGKIGKLGSKAVAILTLLPGVALAARPPERAPLAVRFTTSKATERIPLRDLRGPVTLTVDALAGRIQVRVKNPERIATQIAAQAGILCPRVAVKDGAVELTCASRRIEASLETDKKVTYLDINELRGLPWRSGPDGPPMIHYDPWALGVGVKCPGRNDIARGECLLLEGKKLEAATELRRAMSTPGRPLATIRLGDLALSVGDPATAAGWYRRTGEVGVFGRLAASRLCELEGSCLGSSEDIRRAFDVTGMPEPVRVDLTLRAARAEAYSGRIPSAVWLIAEQARAHGVAVTCREGAELLCRRILLEALQLATSGPSVRPSADEGAPAPRAPGARAAAGTATAAAIAAKAPTPTAPETAAAAAEKPEAASAGDPAFAGATDEAAYLDELMELYLSIPRWYEGPLAIELGQAAARVAVRLGAPSFAGSLLSSLAPIVPEAKLGEHLLLTAQIFVAGQQWARARIIVEYAQVRLHRKKLAGPQWATVIRTLSAQLEENDITPVLRGTIDAEADATMNEIAGAEGVMDKAKRFLASHGHPIPDKPAPAGKRAKDVAKDTNKDTKKDAKKDTKKDAGNKAPGGAEPRPAAPAAPGGPSAPTASNTEAKR